MMAVLRTGELIFNYLANQLSLSLSLSQFLYITSLFRFPDYFFRFSIRERSIYYFKRTHYNINFILITPVKVLSLISKETRLVLPWFVYPFPASHEFGRLLSYLLNIFLGSLFCKQYEPRSDCSLRSSLIMVHTVCCHENVNLNICMQQTTFSGQQVVVG